MLNVNRNINLATPLVKVSGKGPDILPYLTNLKMFIYYSDLASNTILTGNSASIFIPESRWNPYYQYASISASVSGTLFNTLTAPSQAAYSIVSRSVGEGPYFTGSLADPPAIANNQNANSQYQVYISGSSALSDISSSWTYVTYIKPDPTNNIFNYGLYPMNLYNYELTSISGIVKSAGLFMGENVNPDKIIVSTGQQDGLPGQALISGSFNTPGGIYMGDGNYHMITITVNSGTASVYVDNQLASGSGNTQTTAYSWNQHDNAPSEYKNMKFGSNVVAPGVGGKYSTTNRAFVGANKSIAIWDKAFTAADVVGMYGIFLRDNLAPGINVDVNN
jgi:hypothetical protein